MIYLSQFKFNSKAFPISKLKRFGFSTQFNDHYPVMYKEVIELLSRNVVKNNYKKTFYMADLTLGCGNHSKLILEKFPNVKVIGVDVDSKMIDYCNNKLSFFINQNRLSLINDNFTTVNQIDINEHFEEAHEKQLFDFVLLDLGYNSMQLNEEDRGISYKVQESDLDMRLNQANPTLPRASDILNNSTELELYEIFKNFSEDKNAQRMAENVIKYRINNKFLKVKNLIEVIEETVKHKAVDKISTFNKIFQGLRICVNYEILNLENFFPNSIEALEENGVISVISFHSLEDKIVKFFFSEYQKIKLGKVLTKHSVKPSQSEVEENSKSKSAKLRAFLLKNNQSLY